MHEHEWLENSVKNEQHTNTTLIINFLLILFSTKNAQLLSSRLIMGVTILNRKNTIKTHKLNSCNISWSDDFISPFLSPKYEPNGLNDLLNFWASYEIL